MESPADESDDTGSNFDVTDFPLELEELVDTVSIKEKSSLIEEVKLLEEPLTGVKSSSLLTQAIQSIKEFEQGKIDIVPIVRGCLSCMSILNGKVKGPDLRYLLLNPIKGQLELYLS